MRAAVAVPDLAVSRRSGPALAPPRFCDLPAEAAACLVVVVDTEEAFDWSASLERASRAVGHMASIGRVQDIFNALGVVPCYLVSYPIVSQPVGFRPLQSALAEGLARVGAHLSPWVTPPHLEQVNHANSYAGNLPRDLEATKLAALAAQIERSLGVQPTLYKAGRHGKGPNRTRKRSSRSRASRSASARRRRWTIAATAAPITGAIRHGRSSSGKVAPSFACPRPAPSSAHCPARVRSCTI